MHKSSERDYSVSYSLKKIDYTIRFEVKKVFQYFHSEAKEWK